MPLLLPQCIEAGEGGVAGEEEAARTPMKKGKKMRSPPGGALRVIQKSCHKILSR